MATNNGIEWERHNGEEEKEFSGKNTQGGAILLFGTIRVWLRAA